MGWYKYYVTVLGYLFIYLDFARFKRLWMYFAFEIDWDNHAFYFYFFLNMLILKHVRLSNPSNACLASLPDPDNVGLAWLPHLKQLGLPRQAPNQGGHDKLVKPNKL